MSLKTKLLDGILKLTKFPEIPQKPRTGKWYRITLKDRVTSNGKSYHIGFRKGTENKLVILFYGGGVSWNEFMAARPNDSSVNSEEINFYANDAGLIADIAARIGIHIPGNRYRSMDGCGCYAVHLGHPSYTEGLADRSVHSGRLGSLHGRTHLPWL